MAPRRALVIANPASNHGEAAALIPVAADLLEHLFPHELVVTDAPGHAKILAADATGFDVLIAMGGDGTVHEVLNGLMQHPVEARPALSVFPTGSGNDYRRTLGIANDLSRAVMQIASGVRKSVDVGTCNDLYYANSVAVGLDAQVTVKALELKTTTGRSGLPLYLSALMHVLIKEFRTYPMRVQFDDQEPFDTDLLLTVFMHGPTYGGGFHITPDAVGDDGLIDVCRIQAIPQWQTFWRVPFVVMGKHEWMKPVTISRHRSAVLSADAPMPAQIDGEVLFLDTYEIGVLHRALEVVVPRETT